MSDLLHIWPHCAAELGELDARLAVEHRAAELAFERPDRVGQGWLGDAAAPCRPGEVQLFRERQEVTDLMHFHGWNPSSRPKTFCSGSGRHGSRRPEPSQRRIPGVLIRTGDLPHTSIALANKMVVAVNRRRLFLARRRRPASSAAGGTRRGSGRGSGRRSRSYGSSRGTGSARRSGVNRRPALSRLDHDVGGSADTGRIAGGTGTRRAAPRAGGGISRARGGALRRAGNGGSAHVAGRAGRNRGPAWSDTLAGYAATGRPRGQGDAARSDRAAIERRSGRSRSAAGARRNGRGSGGSRGCGADPTRAARRTTGAPAA